MIQLARLRESITLLSVVNVAFEFFPGEIVQQAFLF